MDAKDRLRLYLEQRRELGESELVLDGLPVDEVLRMIGAPKSVSSSAHASTAKTPGAIEGKRSAPTVAPSTSESLPPSYEPPPIAPRIPLTPVDSRSALHPPTEDERLSDKTPSSPTARSQQSPSSNWRDVLQGEARPLSEPVREVARVAAVIPAWLANLGIPIGLSAIPETNAATASAVANAGDLAAVASVIAGCRACALGATALNPVPGDGNADADFVCVGEAPGQTEDETGRPFVGAAGQLLTKILGAIQLQREDVFICNVLKHRPPGNRNPAPDEVRACTPYLTRQLELVKPKVILALGTFAAQTLLNTQTALGKLRGQVHSYQGIPLIVTYHPAALLRNESWKRPTWDDVKLARKILDASRAASQQ